jgi:hypothetical protein
MTEAAINSLQAKLNDMYAVPDQHRSEPGIPAGKC